MDFEILKAQWEELAVWKKLLIVLGISIGIGYLVYMFVISDKITEKNKLQNDIQNLNIEFNNIKRNATPEKRAKLLQELKAEKEKTELLKVELEKLKAKFAPRDDAQSTLVFITDLTRKDNVVLNRFIIKGIKDVYLVYNPATKRIETEVKNSPTNNEESSLIPKSPFNKNKSKEKKQKKPIDMPKVHLKRVDISINLIGSPSDIVKFIKDISLSKNYVRVENVSMSKGGKSDILNVNMDISSYFTTEALKKSQNSEKNNISCKLVDIYNNCRNEALKKKILKNSNKCSKMAENLFKQDKKEYNSACFAGCMDEQNFLKSIQVKCKK